MTVLVRFNATPRVVPSSRHKCLCCRVPENRHPTWRQSPYALSGFEWPATRSPSGRRVAERVGFEPTVPIRVQRFSRPSRSTTPAPLQSSGDGGLAPHGGERNPKLASNWRPSGFGTPNRGHDLDSGVLENGTLLAPRAECDRCLKRVTPCRVTVHDWPDGRTRHRRG